MSTMQSRYPGTCADFGERFPKGALIEYTRNAPRGKKAAHVDCSSAGVEPAPSQRLDIPATDATTEQEAHDEILARCRHGRDWSMRNGVADLGQQPCIVVRSGWHNAEEIAEGQDWLEVLQYLDTLPDDNDKPLIGSSVTVFSSGAVSYTNRNGRCEDAPCCGCCV